MTWIDEWWTLFPSFLTGLLVSLELTVSALAVGLPLGILLALGSIVPQPYVRWPVIVIVEIGRGAPGLIVLYLVYFGLPQFNLTLSSFVSATIALGFTAGAYTAEIFRAGINAVPSGQREASRALGLGWVKELRLVILPQAVKVVIPPLVGFGILLFQGTSLAFVISVPELLSIAYNNASITYEFFGSLTLAGAMYAAVSIVAVSLLKLRRPNKAKAATNLSAVH